MALLRQLYVQVLIGILLAVVLGIVAPSVAVAMKPLGDAFIALLRTVLAPIIFCSIVHGLTHISSMSQLGRLGLKSLVYFEGLTTIAMGVGFIAVNVFQPGAGLHASNLAVDRQSATYRAQQATSPRSGSR